MNPPPPDFYSILLNIEHTLTRALPRQLARGMWAKAIATEAQIELVKSIRAEYAKQSAPNSAPSASVGQTKPPTSDLRQQYD